ncbi:MAG: hypothetical protein A2138_12655 [Deltaproteobacteria bacterium RBG_16_71_12]|nr:MAG: hypothetical protein A2138_12655 [Deltaproteobacteria bacterium RBG_16_71_12]
MAPATSRARSRSTNGSAGAVTVFKSGTSRSSTAPLATSTAMMVASGVTSIESAPPAWSTRRYSAPWRMS